MSDEQEVRRAFELGTNTISPETAERFAAELRAKGLDPAATLAKHGVGQQQQPSAPADRPAPQPMAPDIGPDGLPRLSREQTEQAAATLRKFWTGDPEVLERTLKNAGAAPSNTPVADTRTDEQREFDNSNLAAPVDPASYDLNGLWVGRDGTDAQGYLDADLAESESSLRYAMSQLRIPQALGGQFAEDAADSIAAWDDLREKGDDVAIQQYHLEQNALFAKVCKLGWQEAAAQMKPWLDKLPANAKELIATSGMLESAPARIRLWQSFQLATARAKMGGKP